MAATAIARTPRIPKAIPAPSQFPELLRRSNFAAYDPTIRQTYAAPPSYVHRGNWGLKRPIANRVRHSAIVLRQFEEHAHYIEWDKAPAQVAFVRRVEALNIAPQLEPNTPWMLSLGPAADAIDSDFCPHGATPAGRRAEAPKTEPEVQAPTPDEAFAGVMWKGGRGVGRRATGLPVNVSDTAGREAGGYGKNAETVVHPPPAAAAPPPLADAESYIQPNIAAMTPTQFEAYLAKLRELRPQFKAYLRAEIEKQRGEKEKGLRIDPATLSDEELILNLGEEAKDKGLHRYFLGAHTRAKFDVYSNTAHEELSAEEAAAAANTPQPIQGQPHKLGGLLYSKPTKLETYFSGRAEPGMILQKLSIGNDNFHRQDSNGYITAFAGMTAKLRKDKIATGQRLGVEPLFNPCTEEGIVAPLQVNEAGTGTVRDLKPAVHDMRMIELRLQAPPKVVGKRTINQTMLSVKVNANVAMEGSGDSHSRTNPHQPGTVEYSGQLVVKDLKNPPPIRTWAARDNRGRQVTHYSRFSDAKVGVVDQVEREARVGKEVAAETMSTLQRMIKPRGGPVNK